MKELLEFIIKNLLGNDAKFSIEEAENDSIITLTVKTEEKDGGLIIGKGGKTIKAIRNILRIKATIDKKKIYLIVNPTEMDSHAVPLVSEQV